ncbi:MAG: adenylate/guanylate cyclase domain-containing protein [Acidimicrobiales bacterium]
MDATGGPQSELAQLADSVVPPGRRLTGAQVAAAAGVDRELARRLRRAMGLPDVPDGEAAYGDEDVEALRRAGALISEDGLDVTDVLHLARTLGLASSRMADALVAFSVARRGPGAAGRSAGLVDAGRVADLERVVGYLLRRHLLDAANRRLGSGPGGDAPSSPRAVGFADLVGFTSLSAQLDDHETAELVERFEVLATDRVVASGGRVVKMIGDEVMFSSDPPQAGEIALGLAETFDSPDLPAVRVGAAAGSVVSQSGDLYGPVVNLASRATTVARPGTVLISRGLAELLRADRYVTIPIRPRRLKGMGVVQLEVLRRAEPRR